MVIVWNENAKKQLKKAYEYILKDSYQNALKVRQEIIESILSLSKIPVNTHLTSIR
jgi:hypothetical protein